MKPEPKKLCPGAPETPGYVAQSSAQLTTDVACIFTKCWLSLRPQQLAPLQFPNGVGVSSPAQNFLCACSAGAHVSLHG